ncbi:hypothetical protein ACIRP2_26955 [Streptomyces sp. NPDC101194]|uniref:hypothetical protein n=1 Tax=Streptomyces sp. NPDC101194 TaxID=3366127 RepID=UPI003818A478
MAILRGADRPDGSRVLVLSVVTHGDGWCRDVAFGEDVGLAAAEERIVLDDARRERRSSKVFLEVPSFGHIGARAGGGP